MAKTTEKARQQRMFTQEEVLHWISLLTLMDDEFLEVCFRGNTKAVELLLHIILNREDLQVRRVSVQKSLPTLYGRKVRLEILAVDEADHLYDIEVQVGGKAADLIRRARMYSALLDAGQRVKRMNYRRLRETWVIFITDRDVLRLGQPLYRIERQITGHRPSFRRRSAYCVCERSGQGQQHSLGSSDARLELPGSGSNALWSFGGDGSLSQEY